MDVEFSCSFENLVISHVHVKLKIEVSKGTKFMIFVNVLQVKIHSTILLLEFAL